MALLSSRKITNQSVTTHSGLVRDTEHTERNFLMENREMPILHELPGLRPSGVIPDRSFLPVGISPTGKKSLSP